MKLKTTSFKHYPIGSTIWYASPYTKTLPKCEHCGQARTVDLYFPKPFKIRHITCFFDGDSISVRYFDEENNFKDSDGHWKLFDTEENCEKYIEKTYYFKEQQ